MKRNPSIRDLLDEINNVTNEGEKAVKNIDTDENGHLTGTSDVFDALGSVDSLVDDIRRSLDELAAEIEVSKAKLE